VYRTASAFPSLSSPSSRWKKTVSLCEHEESAVWFPGIVSLSTLTTPCTIAPAAKPVPVNPRNYREYRKGDIIVSLAGIVVNLGLFVACAILFALVGVVGSAMPSLTATFEIVQRMLWWGMWLNVVLAFFNLIPVPPLDGSHVFYHLLPPGWGLKYRQLQGLGFIPVMLLVWVFPGLLQTLLWPAYHLMGVGLLLVRGFAVSPGAFPS